MNIDKNEEMELTGEYMDDGYSEINFKSPNFENLMEEVRMGESKLFCCKRPIKVWKKLYQTWQFH